jgi:hypothetical protein
VLFLTNSRPLLPLLLLPLLLPHRAREEMEERRSNQDEGGPGGSNGAAPGTPNATNSNNSSGGPALRRPPSSSSGSRSSSPGPPPGGPWGGGGVGASMGYVTERWGLYRAGARAWPGTGGPGPYAGVRLDEKEMRAMRMGQLYGRRPQGGPRQDSGRDERQRMDSGSWDDRDGDRWGR